MKKMILTLVLTASIIGALSAQKNAIGLRFGNGGEISFQTALGSANRLELDLGLNSWNNNSNYSGFGLTGVYQWVFGLGSGFNWYAGLGPQIGSWNSNNYSGFALGIVGQVGLEYNFKVPLQLSLDYRPGWYVAPSNYGGIYDGVALGLRYKF